MSRELKVVILSAGQGKRLSPLTDDRPKCLVELSGRSVLHWQLRHLASVGVTEAVVVTGFRADAVEAEIASLDLPGMTRPHPVQPVLCGQPTTSRPAGWRGRSWRATSCC